MQVLGSCPHNSVHPRCHKANLNSIHTRALVLVFSPGTGSPVGSFWVQTALSSGQLLPRKIPRSDLLCLEENPFTNFHQGIMTLATSHRPPSPKSNVFTYQILREMGHLHREHCKLYPGTHRPLKLMLRTYILESSDLMASDREHQFPEVSFLMWFPAWFPLLPCSAPITDSSRFLKLSTLIWHAHWFPLWKEYF